MNVPRLRHIPCELAQNLGRVRSRRGDNLGRSEAGRNLERRLASLRSEPSQTLIQEDSQWCDRVEVAPLVHCQVLNCEAQVGL